MTNYKKTAADVTGIQDLDDGSLTIWWDAESGTFPFNQIAEVDDDGCYEIELTKDQAYALWSLIDCTYDSFNDWS